MYPIVQFVEEKNFDTNIAKIDALHVDYYKDYMFALFKNLFFRKESFWLIAKTWVYCMSYPTNKNQYSLWYANCQWLLLTQEQTNGSLLASLAHYNPEYLFISNALGLHFTKEWEKWRDDIYRIVRKFPAESYIQWITFAGNVLSDDRSQEYYEHMMRTIQDLLYGLAIRVQFVWPKLTAGVDDVYRDNHNQTLSILRDAIGLNTQWSLKDILSRTYKRLESVRSE